MIIAEFSLIPMGTSSSVGRYIRAIHEMLKKRGVNFVPGAMGTTVEAATFEELCIILELANKTLTDMEVPRVITSVKIDLRRDKEISIDSKMKSLE